MPSKTVDKTSANGASRTAQLAEVETIVLPRLARVTLSITVMGTRPLIVHRFSEKARKSIVDPPARGAVREKRDQAFQRREFEASMYRFKDGGHGFPAVAFKAAIVNAAEAFPKLHMTTLKKWIYVSGETIDGSADLVRLRGPEPKQREDYVRLKSGMKTTTDVHWRAEYWPWKTDLVVTYPGMMFPKESILALVDAAGFGGVGEWRPSSPESKTGSYGTFEVSEDFEGALNKRGRGR